MRDDPVLEERNDHEQKDHRTSHQAQASRGKPIPCAVDRGELAHERAGVAVDPGPRRAYRAPGRLLPAHQFRVRHCVSAGRSSGVNSSGKMARIPARERCSTMARMCARASSSSLANIE